MKMAKNFPKWLGWTYKIRPGREFSVRISGVRQVVTFSHEDYRVAEVHFPRNGFEAAAGFVDGLQISVDGRKRGLARTYSDGRSTDAHFNRSAVILWNRDGETLKVATLRMRGFFSRLIGNFFWQQMINEQRATEGEPPYIRARRERQRQVISQIFNTGVIILVGVVAFIAVTYLIVTVGNAIFAPILGNWALFPAP